MTFEARLQTYWADVDAAGIGDFEIVDDQSSERLAAGYVTVVCVDARFKSIRIA